MDHRPAAGPEVARLLLDAQVAWVMDELDPDRLARDLVIAARAAAEPARGPRLRDLVDQDSARRLVRAVVLLGPRTSLVRESVPRGAATAHHGVGRSSDRLCDVLDRDDVAALADALLVLRGDGQLLTERLLSSPTAMTVGVRVVGRIVADVLAQNRSLAEKLPGVGGLLSLGTGAINRAGRLSKVVADGSGLGDLLGEALGAGAAVTVRRTSAIVHETVTDDVVKAIVLELYDAHAETPVTDLRLEATTPQVQAIAAQVHAIIAGAGRAPGAPGAVDEQVDAFLEAYADHDIAALVGLVGLKTHDEFDDAVWVAHTAAALAPLLRSLRSSGSLERLVRRRLAPFWESPAVAILLTGTDPTRP